MFLLVIVAGCVLATHVLPRWEPGLRTPVVSLILWQAVSLAAVLAGLLLAPVVVLHLIRTGRDLPDPVANLPMLVVALLVTGVVAARLAVRGHLVGTALRGSRREHGCDVDLLATPGEAIEVRRGIAFGSAPRRAQVLSNPSASAYCVPGAIPRVVLTDAACRELDDEALRAVVAHEVAHLRQRHDLILEFFTVLHTAVPARLRSTAGLQHDQLLVEILADRSAAQSCGRPAVARAIVAIAGAAHPPGSLGSAGAPAVSRLRRLADPAAYRGQALGLSVLSALVLLAPLAVTGWALSGH